MEWISVKNRLPEKDGIYLVFGNTTGGGFGIDMARFFEVEFIKMNQPTHWMELPPPPIENPK